MTTLRVKLIYFNQRWNVYMYTTAKTGWVDSEWLYKYEQEVKTMVTPEGHMYEARLRKHTHDVLPAYSYGHYFFERNHRPGHDGEWSSRCEIINKEFDINIIEVAIDQCSMAVPYEWLKRLMGNLVVWGEGCCGPEITHVHGMENVWDNVFEFHKDI